jgi:hypothetical protein
LRKFQYVVTIDLDDDYLSTPEVIKELKNVPGVDESNPVYSVAEDKFPEAITETLMRGMGEAGATKVSVTFDGEVK